MSNAEIRWNLIRLKYTPIGFPTAKAVVNLLFQVNMMKYFLLTCSCFLWLTAAAAQQTERDSLKKILFHPDTPPAQRKAARDALLHLPTDTLTTAVERPQTAVLSCAAEALAQATRQQDSVLLRLTALFADTTALLEEKCRAIQLLAQLGTPSAYAFLIEHLDADIPALGDADQWYSDKAIFVYLAPYARRNWRLMQEIMSVLAKKKFNEAEIVPITVLLDTIVEADAVVLQSLLGAFDQKINNDIFRANKKAIEDMNVMLRGE
jgi:hypothetical protein